MDWKEFFKPTILVVLLTIILFFLSTYLSNAEGRRGIPDYNGEGYGFPLRHLVAYDKYYPEFPPIGAPDHRIDVVGLIVDIIFWYLVSLIISYGIKKIRRKVKPS